MKSKFLRLTNLNLSIDGRVTVILRDDRQGKTIILAEGKITPQPKMKTALATVRITITRPKKPAAAKTLKNWLSS